MTPQLPNYCKILHEVSKPTVNSSVRGMHYSVYETTYLPVNPGETKTQNRFVLLWDEDHDTRVFSVIEALAESGILPYVAVIGERKAGVIIVLNKNISRVFSNINYIKGSRGNVDLNEIGEAVRARVELDYDDEWNTQFYLDHLAMHYSYQKENEIISKYLELLDDLWDLQLKRL